MRFQLALKSYRGAASSAHFSERDVLERDLNVVGILHVVLSPPPGTVNLELQSAEILACFKDTKVVWNFVLELLLSTNG